MDHLVRLSFYGDNCGESRSGETMDFQINNGIKCNTKVNIKKLLKTVGISKRQNISMNIKENNEYKRSDDFLSF
jgi:hypothetical protein